MGHSAVSLTGALAALLSTGAYLPQVIRTWRTRSTADISLLMFAATVLGAVLWLIYGLALGDGPIIATNGAILVLAAIMLIFKLRYG